MRITLLATISTALMVAAPVAAQTSQTGSASSTAAQSTKLADNDQANSEKKVCKRLETSGTRMAKRVCLTESEWKKVEAEK